MDFQTHQNRYQQEQIDCYEPQRLLGELPKVLSNLGILVKPGPRFRLLDFVLLKNRIVSSVDWKHYQYIREGKNRREGNRKDPFGKILAVIGHYPSKDLVPHILAAKHGNPKQPKNGLCDCYRHPWRRLSLIQDGGRDPVVSFLPRCRGFFGSCRRRAHFCFKVHRRFSFFPRNCLLRSGMKVLATEACARTMKRRAL